MGLEPMLASMRARNAQEADAFRDIVRDYTTCIKSNQTLRDRVRQLEREVAELSEDKAGFAVALKAAEEAAGKGNEAAALQARVDQLQQDLTNSYKENAQVSQELALVTANYQVVREENTARGSQLADTTRRLSEAEARVNALEGEVAEAVAATDAATTELESRLAEKLAAEDKAMKLEAENQQLIARWMEHKMREAEQLNEANAIYEDVVRSAETAKRHMEGQLSQAGGSGPGVLAQLGLEGGARSGPVAAPQGARHTLRGHEGGCHGLDFDRLGTRLVSGGVDRTVKIWEPASGNLLVTLRGMTGTVLDVKFCPSEQRVLGAGADHALRLWEIESERVLHTLTGHSDKVATCTFLGNDARGAASAGQDRTVRLWDLTKGYCLRTIMCHSGVNAICATLDGATVCTGHFDGALRFWDARTGKMATEVSAVHSQQVTGVVLTPGGAGILSAGRDNVLRLVDVRTLEARRTYRAPGLKVAANWSRPCMSPDEQFVAMGSSDGRVYMWEAADGRPIAAGGGSLSGHTQQVSVCTWSSAGAPMASCDKAGMIMLWQ